MRCSVSPEEYLVERYCIGTLPLMTEQEVIDAAREVVTNVSWLADAEDRDWNHSLMLMLCMLDPMPPNASTLLLVPRGPHMGGRFLNGRVPGVTLSAKMIPMENVEAVLAKIREFDVLLTARPADE